MFAESLSGPLYVFLLQQFQRIDDDPAKKPLVLAHKRTIEGSTTEVYDLSGPWCDVWSLGVMVLQFCLGSPSQEDKTEVLMLKWCLFKEIQTLKNGSVFWLYPYQLCEVTHLNYTPIGPIVFEYVTYDINMSWVQYESGCFDMDVEIKDLFHHRIAGNFRELVEK